jgi:hypothetical protein
MISIKMRETIPRLSTTAIRYALYKILKNLIPDAFNISDDHDWTRPFDKW